MSPPYGLMADIHAHNWATFARLDEKGRNTRLVGLCAEMLRCATMVREAGGRDLIIAGDLFHVRGQVVPSVFNTVRGTLAQIADLNMIVTIMPGNHDLTGPRSEELGSSVAMLTRMNNVYAPHQPVQVGSALLVPWEPDMRVLLDRIRELAGTLSPVASRDTDLILHCGIEGALSGVPTGHALDPKDAAALGFKRVFSGHYHNHASFLGGKVWSIGAPAHHTWGDAGTKAGFLIVHPDRVQFIASHQPRFVRLDAAALEDETALLDACDGNYVRVRLGKASHAEVEATRTILRDHGAREVVVEVIPESVGEKREGAAPKASASLSDSVLAYCRESGHDTAIQSLCMDILREARS